MNSLLKGEKLSLSLRQNLQNTQGKGNAWKKAAEELEVTDDGKHSGFFVFGIDFAFFILLSLKSKHTQKGLFKNIYTFLQQQFSTPNVKCILPALHIMCNKK